MSRAPIYRAPWGYLRAKDGHLVAGTGQAQIQQRAEIGETAIRLLAALGVGIEQLEDMADDEEPSAMIAKLQRNHQPQAPVHKQLELPFTNGGGGQ